MIRLIALTSAIVLLNSSCGQTTKFASLKALSDSQKTYRSTRWLDGRPKLILNPEHQPSGLTHDNLVRAWIRQEADSLGVSPRLDNLRLNRVRRSAKGIHYEFVTPDGIGAVRNSVLYVSLTADGSKIYRAYNGLAPKGGEISSPSQLRVTKDEALQIAWKHLKVNGKLLREPTAVLVNDQVAGVRKLWWLVSLETTSPAGSWEYLIDPASGAVAKSIDRRSYDVNLEDARRELNTRQSAKPHTKFESTPVSGSAKLFVVDPRTALNRADLKDDSPASMFEQAYEVKSLEGISHTEDGFELLSRRVTLADWDAPFSGVSKTSDGTWTSGRGENPFNDTMTWWHLDQSVKSMESLGFVNEAKIFEGSLVADPNGYDGQDNSFFTPTINALSFGHGCVDDNEDPDVILHEMGHAINAAINPYWQGGDTGAMGEGFGDYWAISYGFADSRNRTGDKFRVFNWDGSSGCWDGRRADRREARYKRGSHYDAHDPGADGVVSDELWSTPLVSSLDELLNAGIAKQDVDLIVLESQFGLAHSLNMNDWANALVQTADLLFPNGPHAEIFAKHFHHHLIMTPRSSEIIYSSQSFANAGHNNVPDPGETFDFNIELFNIGDAASDEVKATLVSKSDWATVKEPSADYGNVGELSKASGKSPFKIAIHPDVACGKLTLLEAEIVDKNGLKTIVPVEFPLGIPGAEVEAAKRTPDLAIPDHDQSGIKDTLTMSTNDDAVIRDGFSLDIAISHPSVTDVKIVLITPLGHEIVLKSFLSGNRSDTDIIGNFPTTLHPVEDFSALIGQPLNGNWTIQVVDGFEGGKGKLLAWGIRNPTGRALCEH